MIIKVVKCSICNKREDMGELTADWYLAFIGGNFFSLTKMTDGIQITPPKEIKPLHFCPDCMERNFSPVVNFMEYHK